MSNRQDDRNDRASVVAALREQGLSRSQIAQTLGVSISSVKRAFASIRRSTQAAGPQLRIDADSPRVECEWTPRQTPEEEWREAAAHNAQSIEKMAKANRFHLTLHTSRPIGIAFVSDQHISEKNAVDLALMERHARLIADTPRLYAIGVGDMVDNHNCIHSAMLAARSTPEDQYRLTRYYLSLFRDKWLLGISGNHDAWTNQKAGVDVLRMLHENAGLAYSAAHGMLHVTVGTQAYKIAVRHQYRHNSGLNAAHSIQQWQRQCDTDDVDVAVQGHTHESIVVDWMHQGRNRVAIKPGSYQVASSFSRQYGFPDATATAPVVIFWPDSRRFSPFRDIDAAADYLNKS